MTIRKRTIAERVAESRRGNSQHKLLQALPGRNRFRQGHYVCSCGAPPFTGMNAWEAHRANAKRGVTEHVVS